MPKKSLYLSRKSGFTLIELSIVLVVIGLIVGGVLVGQDLIKAAEIRAQISQIEKYNTAANTFKNKYGYLPGDIPDPYASNFGFLARATDSGNNDGLIKGLNSTGYAGGCGFCSSGEPLMFWVDLASAGLINGKFNTATASSQPYISGGNVDTIFPSYLPVGKMGKNYINIWSGGVNVTWAGPGDRNNDGKNYFQLSQIYTFWNQWQIYSNPGLTTLQSQNMDKKIDDGLPQSGNVVAIHLALNLSSSYEPVWAGTGGVKGNPYITATSGSSTTCFDNNNVTGAIQQYSVNQDNGNDITCALSFKAQF